MTDLDRLALTMYRLAGEAEIALITRISRALARGVDAPGWAQRQLGDLARLRRGWEADVGTWLLRGQAQAVTVVGEAGEWGAARAHAELRVALRRTALASPLPGAQGVMALAEELSGMLGGTRFGVLRATEDVFRSVVAQASAQVLLGAQTRRGVAQTVLDRLVARGISGFTDTAGRRWELASYVEMSTRTVTQRAAVQAHADSLVSAGVDLVIVSDARQECKLCRAWEGKVLSLSGAGAGTYPLPSAVDPDRTVQVKVSGTLDQAKRAGLFHPNCRHSASAYLPGLTKPARTATADPQGDADRQRLRELERRVRREKLREAAALDLAAQARARARARAAQAAIRDHVDSTSAKRQPARERIGVAR